MISISVFRMVSDFFEGDVSKAKLWFYEKNTLLGGISPVEMISLGRTSKLEKLIRQTISENKGTEDVKSK